MGSLRYRISLQVFNLISHSTFSHTSRVEYSQRISVPLSPMFYSISKSYFSKLKGSGQKRPNWHFVFFLFVLKSGWCFACDPTLLHMLTFGNKKQTSQKYYRTLIFLLMLGHMQKVSTNEKKRIQLGRFCPEIIPYNIIIIL